MDRAGNNHFKACDWQQPLCYVRAPEQDPGCHFAALGEPGGDGGHHESTAEGDSGGEDFDRWHERRLAELLTRENHNALNCLYTFCL